jgi:hypothetical protein
MMRLLPVLLLPLFLLLSPTALAQEVRVVDGRKYIVHTVQQGQTLYAISRHYAVPVDAITTARVPTDRPCSTRHLAIAPPYEWSRTYMAAKDMEEYLPGVPLDATLVEATEDGFDVLASDGVTSLVHVVVERQRHQPLRPGDPVVATVAVEGVVAQTPIDKVIAFDDKGGEIGPAEIDRIGVGVAADQVVAVSAHKVVRSAPAPELVVSGPAVEDVVAGRQNAVEGVVVPLEDVHQAVELDDKARGVPRRWGRRRSQSNY